VQHRPALCFQLELNMAASTKERLDQLWRQSVERASAAPKSSLITPVVASTVLSGELWASSERTTLLVLSDIFNECSAGLWICLGDVEE
jgi:hypothetical protein